MFPKLKWIFYWHICFLTFLCILSRLVLGLVIFSSILIHFLIRCWLRSNVVVTVVNCYIFSFKLLIHTTVNMGAACNCIRLDFCCTCKVIVWWLNLHKWVNWVVRLSHLKLIYWLLVNYCWWRWNQLLSYFLLVWERLLSLNIDNFSIFIVTFRFLLHNGLLILLLKLDLAQDWIY